MQFKRVLPISDHPVARKKPSYQNRTPASIQKQHVQRFEESGLKQVEFCEQHNIPCESLPPQGGSFVLRLQSGCSA